MGPCSCNGETSGSVIDTFKSELTATPCAHNKISLSAKDSQKWFSPNLNKTGSFNIPPSLLVISTYLHCPTANLDKSLGVSNWINLKASGPVISTCRSTATSHRIELFTRFQKFSSGFPKSRGIYMWL